MRNIYKLLSKKGIIPILSALYESQDVSSLVLSTGYSQPYVSACLSELRKYQLVSVRVEGNKRLYKQNEEKIIELCEEIENSIETLCGGVYLRKVQLRS